ncbi:hypothetical protein GGR54DRAFT_613996 [Hypoxylon sp. NC1633]|nr:hypothetical protein GGR54DRAFT_613996 [Hypoxylon sp. NC1633]
MNREDRISLPKGLKGARLIMARRDRRGLPIRATVIPPPSFTLREAAARTGESSSSIHRQLVALRKGLPCARSSLRSGRPTKLTDAEDRALTLFISLLQRGGFPVDTRTVRSIANELLARRTPPELQLAKNKSVDGNRITPQDLMYHIESCSTLY